jgi:predicted nucleic acid-binding protein
MDLTTFLRGEKLSMALPKASLDASFWINAHQAGLTPFLPEYFQLFVCSEVEREILHPLTTKGLPVAAALQFQEWCETKIITRQEPARPVDWYHVGENAAIALAIESDYVLLIDDQNPYHYARSKGLKVVNSADFVVLLYHVGKLSYTTAESTIGRLGLGKHLARTALAALGMLGRRKGER